MQRQEYAEMFARIERDGADARVHWASGPRAGRCEPWDGRPESLPGHPARFHGASCRESEEGIAYAEELMGAPRLLILGAGHVGVATAALAATLGFQITVVDARPEFAVPERVPGAQEVICAPYEEALRAQPAYANAYTVIVTPGHASDRVCAAAALRRPFAYIGMIGSRGKVATVRAALLEQGFTAEEFDQIHAPIGLPLGGREPAEIAVSICAEMIQVRSARGARVIEPAVRLGLRALAEDPQARGALATIIGHGGSVPRGVGSRMLIGPDGLIAGSVGGGAVEAAVLRRGRELCGQPGAVDLMDLDLSDREGAELGMICGGRVRVLVESL